MDKKTLMWCGVDAGCLASISSVLVSMYFIVVTREIVGERRFSGEKLNETQSMYVWW